MRTTLAIALAAAFLPAAAGAAAGEVTFLKGSAFRTPEKGGKVALKVSSQVEKGDLLETGADGKLELTLPDQSVVRLAPNSKLKLDETSFTDSGRSFKATLKLGKAWSKVSSVMGSERNFEVRTERAVAGVRGTVFRVDAAKTKAVLVRVYAGSVAVAGVGGPTLAAPAPQKGERVQIQGPQQVSRQQWEKIVSAQMQIRVSEKGEPGEPEKYSEAEDAQDPWAAWNRERDAAQP